jgi:hypothetical protein
VATPNVIFMAVPGLSLEDARRLAIQSYRLSVQAVPKRSKKLSLSLEPFWAPGQFGVSWTVDYAFYQEEGIRPFTMKSLAGKTIPMWVQDHKLRDENPKIETKVESGVLRVLIFRKAAPIGSRKIVRRNGRDVNVPRSYPGAPGRIASRYSEPIVPPGKYAGMIARGNVGVRWRHPGLDRKGFITDSIVSTAHHAAVVGRLHIGSM